jgi:hypothetical protein
MDLIAPALWCADLARGWRQRQRRVRVLVHRGIFLPTSPEHYFMKVTNLSASREIELTHIWFETKPPVHVLNPDRPLPARLRLDETFETSLPVVALPNVQNVERLGRVRLSNGKVIKSRRHRKVPPVGYMAGAGSR